ncbi:MAG: hypothetical protein IT317_03035 [Anaerolineales bacterium]|nr:hypothetical protein [Anaerolineales bacterium]
MAVLFSGSGRTYELALVFPTGYAASQALLTGYTGIVEGFRLDVDRGPTPTAPVRQDLGAGPFLTEDQRLFLDGVSGQQLCGEEIAPPAGTAMPLPPGAPTAMP